jgi:O-succinylbenzoic acid--CoA ligase
MFKYNLIIYIYIYKLTSKFITLSFFELEKRSDWEELLKDSLTDFKLPKELRIVKDFPKTDTGKVKRWELVKKFG